ncbi:MULTISPECIES: hypothetical protein [Niastella]|uniref:Beta-1,6-galactofuranosyltransferase n=1 Tax=Niastella soli TaxID=2821487 RepID=A0ABS3YUW0_9BACT|nr:hypothetical protein [Niastella soli]MBO9201675.1 hypothetical protein [Niastella soli]
MPIAKKYFIQEFLHHEFVHGGIGNVDGEKIFVSRGYRPIDFPGRMDFSIQSKLKRFLYLIRLFFSLSSRDLVVFQFPLYAKIHQLLITLLSIKGAQIICVIQDMEGWRDDNRQLFEKEKKALRRIRLFVAHNERMQQWLQTLVPKATIECFQFHDFLTTPVCKNRSKQNHIVIAGDLAKTTFIEKLGQLPRLSFSVYGEGYPVKNTVPDNVTFKGVYPPYELVHHVQGSFGLVWYGEAIDSFDGIYSSYLTVITPHKLSLYILAGIPVIVPATSASAILVKQYGIGYSIEKLSEMEEMIRNTSDQEYQAMVENMRPLAMQISQGHFLTKALDQLEQAL